MALCFGNFHFLKFKKHVTLKLCDIILMEFCGERFQNFSFSTCNFYCRSTVVMTWKTLSRKYSLSALISILKVLLEFYLQNIFKLRFFFFFYHSCDCPPFGNWQHGSHLAPRSKNGRGFRLSLVQLWRLKLYIH